MLKLVIGSAFGLLLFSNTAMATCSSYPYAFSSGTTADASQVNANFNCAALTSGATLDSITLTGTTLIPGSGVITSTGSVGIGTTSPGGYRVNIIPTGSDMGLKVTGVNDQWTAWFQGSSTTSHSFGPEVFAGTNSSDTAFRVGNAALSTVYFMVRGDGNVGVGTTSPGQKLDVSGTIRQSGCTTAGTLAVNSSGDIICSSDARLKNILGDYKDGLSAVLRITPSRFSYKPTPSNPHEEFVHAGFIAQDVKAALPQAVALQRSGYYSLDTTAILAASVNAIKELKAANDDQHREIAALRAQIVSLERSVRVRSAAR